jgi:hypothetical protein
MGRVYKRSGNVLYVNFHRSRQLQTFIDRYVTVRDENI